LGAQALATNAVVIDTWPMRRGVGRDRLSRAAAIAVALFVSALLLWVAGLVWVDGTSCPVPRTDQIGLEADRSLWPPGAECSGGSVVQAFDGITTVLVVLVATGVVVLAAGLVGAVKYRNLRGPA
jgi:hypothetical protein